jgi:hypothetical protein
VDFTIKQGDTRTKMKATLYNPLGSVVDLTGASAQLILSDQNTKVTVPATIQDAAKGIVWVSFTETSLDSIKGWVRGEIRITYSDSNTETFPNNGYLKVHVLERL